MSVLYPENKSFLARQKALLFARIRKTSSCTKTNVFRYIYNFSPNSSFFRMCNAWHFRHYSSTLGARMKPRRILFGISNCIFIG